MSLNKWLDMARRCKKECFKFATEGSYRTSYCECQKEENSK